MSSLINCPPLSFEQFMTIPNGTRVYNYGADQCVALANQYHVGTLNGTLAGTYIQSAFQWWTDFEKYPQFYNVYNKVTSNPQRGDIFVTNRSSMYDPIHGHIGVVERSWDGSTFGTIEQNAGSGAKRWAWRYNRDMRSIAGFLRPKSLPSNLSEGNKKMLMIHRTIKGNLTFAIFGPNFWLEFIGNDTANAFAGQILNNGTSVQVSPDFWEYCKAASKAGITVNVQGSTAGVDNDALAKAVNDEIAKRMQG